MALKILLADDSMTAQKLGKEILLSGGYEVIAVSNGAAAAKKLLDKPDMAILDVFMPGFTGLEICEKIRGSMDMAKMPVLLTVGKMEHFDPQDSARVKADGVIIKPFEASDLLAALKKLEKKLQPAEEVPSYEKTMVFKAPQIEEFKDQSYAEWKVEAQDEPEAPPPLPMVMSQEMGSAPAFADDMMSAPAPSATTMDETVAFPPAIPVANAPSFDETVNFPPMVSPASMDDTVRFDQPVKLEDPGPMAATFTPIEAEHVESLMKPATDHEVEFTAAPRGLDAKVFVDPTLEVESAEVAAPMRDPALVTDPTTMATEFPTKFGVDKEPEDSYVRGFEKGEVAEAAPSDDDFEARVAAAMSSFDAGESSPPAEAVAEAPEPVAPSGEDTQQMKAYSGIDSAAVVAPAMVASEAVEPEVEEPQLEPSQIPPEGMQDAALMEQMQAAFADLPVEHHPPPVEEPVEAAPADAAPVIAAPVSVTSSGPDLELASALAAAVGGEAPAPLAAAVGSMPSVQGMDPHAVAQMVSRVMERMLPSIMHEVVKEIDAAKKS